jgi:hypothetical protein
MKFKENYLPVHGYYFYEYFILKFFKNLLFNLTLIHLPVFYSELILLFFKYKNIKNINNILNFLSLIIIPNLITF